jgi:hypothetical protein
MQDVAMRRRLAALLALSGAALTTAFFAADAQAQNFVGTDRGERIVEVNTGNSIGGSYIRGTFKQDDLQDLRVNDGDAMDG